MDFGLTPEQRALADSVRRHVSDRCPTTRVRAAMESADGHDRDLWQGLVDLGVTAIAAPAAHGGMDGELLDLALVAEELGYACVPGPFLGVQAAIVALAAGDDEGAQAAWLPRLVAGDALATVAVGEAGGRWEAHEMSARVRGGCLTGTKTMVPYGSIAEAHVVAACEDDSGPGLWLVERGAAGVSTNDLSGNDHTRRLSSVEYRESPARRVGGLAVFERMRDAALVMIAADAYGGARRCLDMAREHALTRRQFGQPIGAFQAVKHQLANLAVDLTPACSLWWYAAHALDRLPGEGPRHAALAKAWLTDLFDRAARDSTEIHGGIGFTWEFDLHLWFRRSIFDRSFFGDAHFQRARAARLAGW